MLVKGKKHQDERGVLYFNNDFDASLIKRIYTVQNKDVNFIRGWQGHKIENRWFSAVYGAFEISTVKIDNWESPSKSIAAVNYILEEGLDILYVPSGFITAIQARQNNAKLLVMSDYHLGEVNDEYRLPINYFTNR